MRNSLVYKRRYLRDNIPQVPSSESFSIAAKIYGVIGSVLSSQSTAKKAKSTKSTIQS